MKIVNLLLNTLIILITGWLIMLYLGAVHAGELEQATAETSLVYQILEKCQSILDAYGWSLAGVFVSPFIVFRGVQYVKKAAKSINRPLNRWAMDMISIVAVFCLSYVFLSQNPTAIEQNLIVAGIIAALHIVIVKAIFRFAPERLSSVLTEGVFVDEETTTFSKTVLAAVVGKRGDMREGPR